MSWKDRATTCIPTGIPLEANPHGTVIAGEPVVLKSFAKLESPGDRFGDSPILRFGLFSIVGAVIRSVGPTSTSKCFHILSKSLLNWIRF